MGGDLPPDAITSIPGVADLGPWVLIAVLLAPKLWDGVMMLMGKRQESEAAKATAEVSVEIERIKSDFERQKDFQDDLIAECQRLRDECKQLRDHNYALAGSVMERDAIIRDRDATIAKMQRELDELRKELDEVKRELKGIEDRRHPRQEETGPLQ